MNILSFNSIEGLESIDFCLENCDVISVPLENIKKGCIDYTPGERKSNHLFIHLIDNGNIEISSGYRTSPCQRLSAYEDVVGIDLIFGDGHTERIDFPWFNEDYCTNKYQASNLISYKEVQLSIDRRNHYVDICDALDYEDDTVFELSRTNEKIVVKTLNDDKVFISQDTGSLLTFSRSLLSERFIVIDSPSY